MIEYVAGSTKGGIKQGDVFNNPFELGAMSEDRTNYTAQFLAETQPATPVNKVAWTPVLAGSHTIASGAKFDIKVVCNDSAATVLYANFKLDADRIAGDITKTKLDWFTDAGVATSTHTWAEGDKIAYCYDNVVIPQNDLPILNARTKDIPLVAKPRRIAVYYSQMAAFELKTEYGEDLGQNLSEQAIGELKYKQNCTFA